jgi:hypothetical protein
VIVMVCCVLVGLTMAAAQGGSAPAWPTPAIVRIGADVPAPSKEDAPVEYEGHFFKRLCRIYLDEMGWCKKDRKDEKKEGDKPAENGGADKKDNGGAEKKDGDKPAQNGGDEKKNGEPEKNGGAEEPEKPRRALPSPWQSPPFPNNEYQGFPLIGVPPSDAVYPLMKAIYGGPCGDEIKESRIKAYGWFNASGNYSTAKASNTPDSYWVAPNRFVLDQAVLRLEREPDTVQTDHLDWGFRFTGDYGIDYRFFTAGGWFSDQLLVHNFLYGWDLTEAYAEVYVPRVAQGMRLMVGRWIATPDIETQYAPDNYMGTHSILFTVDVYTETGVMATVMLNEQWTVQAALHAGADMAPWYKGAVPTGMLGARWVSRDNKDSFYTVLNAVNNAEFRYFDLRGQPAGHHNYNIFQTTWQHTFCESFFTKTEAYVMWERNAAVGGTPSIGPFQFNTGGGIGPTVPGLSLNYAVLNYTMFKLSKNDFLTVRNEWAQDEHGTRYGFAGNYTSHAIGLTHNFNSVLQIRPEIGYYRNWTQPAFDNGAAKGIWLYGFDVTWRF